MKPISLERSLWINAPTARVWQAINDPDQIVKWFTPNLPGAQMVCDEHHKLIVQLGPMSVDFAIIEASDEPTRLTIRNLPDSLTTTTYSLKEENGGTRVTVTAAGFEFLLQDGQQDRLTLCGAGWEKALKNLDAFVNARELPFPQAFVGPLFGYWRETKKTLSSERSIWINASRERVWRAVTDPNDIQRWLSPGTAWALSAIEMGGRFYVPNEETHAEMYVEVIEILDPPNYLATRSIPELPDTIVKGKAYTLVEENGGTRLTVTLSGYEQEPEESRWGNMEQNTFGFGMMLQNAKAYLEGETLPFPFGF